MQASVDIRSATKNLKELDFTIETNRKKLFDATNNANLMDPLLAIIFFFHGNTTMLCYPHNPFHDFPLYLRTLLMTAVFVMYTDIDYNAERKIIVTKRAVNKFIHLYMSKQYWNNIYISSLQTQPNVVPFTTTIRKPCNLFNPNNFAIPTLRNIVLIYLHRSVGFHELISMHTLRINYHARDYVLSKKNELPTQLIQELLLLNNSCLKHPPGLVLNKGTELNKCHLIVRRNSELHVQLLNIDCPIAFLTKIFTRIEALGLVTRYVRFDGEHNRQKLKDVLESGFALIENYDADYSGF